ncbi:MAG: saccharopine dehydrogenase NADP-binding domain-containing protein [Phycisphaerae bacterium]|nr:saccharopine dehydrogenase NADP-binding domain-containing protein [Phycisphaerae bacterium]
MKNVLVLGGGKVGKSVAELLLACGKGAYRVTVADREDSNLRETETIIAGMRPQVGFPVEFATKKLDASDKSAVREALKGQHYVVCMLPYHLVAGIAEMANELGVHYFDVTEDVRTTDGVKALDASGKARVALMPQCGLAPGYIAIAAHEVARRFSRLHDLTLRVGALPQYPTNSLRYNVTWSAAGVVNEYCEPCNVMLDGHMVKVPALDGLERFSFEGVEYEAFYTSGGIGSIVETLQAEGRTIPRTNIAYKTIRYPGHCQLMKFLLQELRLEHNEAPVTPAGRVFNRAMAIDLLEYAVPRTIQDVVVIFANGIGMAGEGPLARWEQVNFHRSIRATRLLGRTWPAIELTTAAGVCAMVDLHRLGKLRQSGFIKQEEVSLATFNQTIFGMAYEAPEKLEAAVLGG